MKKEEKQQHDFIFHKKNYLFMFIGLAVIALGFILMSGGGSNDPNVLMNLFLISKELGWLLHWFSLVLL